MISSFSASSSYGYASFASVSQVSLNLKSESKILQCATPLFEKCTTPIFKKVRQFGYFLGFDIFLGFISLIGVVLDIAKLPLIFLLTHLLADFE